MVFDEGFLKTLEALNHLARRSVIGDDRADRRTQRKGASIEFADYRRYVPGDEIRYIDWNVYARHGALFVKEFAAEENLHVSMMLDTSRSMAFGGKFEAACEMTAALSYIGLANYDTVSLYTFGSELGTHKRFLRGKGRIFELFSVMEHLTPEGITNMRQAFRLAMPRLRGRSLVLVLSDFYDLAGYQEAVRGLLAQHFEVHLIHVLAREELAPTLRGRFHMRDLETGRVKDLSILPRTIEAYRRRFGQFCTEIEEFARSHELPYARVMADDPLDRRVIDVLRSGGILEHR
jgi:uncharacterized protein (DUF58 family)